MPPVGNNPKPSSKLPSFPKALKPAKVNDNPVAAAAADPGVAWLTCLFLQERASRCMHLSFLQLRRDATWPSSRLRGARRAAQPYRIADCVAAGLVSSSAKRCILLKSLNPDSKPKASGQAAAAMRMPAAMGLRAAAAKVFEKKRLS